MNTQFESAIIAEQDKNFAVVSVQPAIFQNATDASMIIKALLPAFNGIPVVLVTIDDEGTPAYYGRSDLVSILGNINIKEAAWNQISADIDLNNSSCPSKEENES